MERIGTTDTLHQLVDKPSLCGQRFIYAGGARGGKARLELNQMSRKALPCKACVERSDYFRAARRHKNNDIISGCRKSLWLFRQPDGAYRYNRYAPFLMPTYYGLGSPSGRAVTAGGGEGLQIIKSNDTRTGTAVHAAVPVICLMMSALFGVLAFYVSQLLSVR